MILLVNFAFIILGVIVGFLSGMFGIGGGILITPALVFMFGFTQKMATGTTLALMLPPIGILAFVEYYKNGMVNLWAAVFIICGFLAGSSGGAKLVMKLDELTVKRSFGIMLISIGLYYISQKK